MRINKIEIDKQNLKRSHSAPEVKSVTKKQKVYKNAEKKSTKKEKGNQIVEKKTIDISELKSNKYILENFKEINKRRKIVEWLKHVDNSEVAQSLPKIRKESASSDSSIRKEEKSTTKNHVISTNQSEAWNSEPPTIVTVVVESDSSAGESSKENCHQTSKAVDSQKFKIPKKGKPEENSTKPQKNYTKPQDNSIRPQGNSAVKPQWNQVSKQARVVLTDTLKMGADLNMKKRDLPSTSQPSPKKMRPASFILKHSGVNESCQTNITAVNLKELKTCVTPEVFKLRYKYTIDLKHDMFAHHTNDTFYDSKGNELTPWVQHVVDNFQRKNECAINENSNCFITLNSRFKVFETKDFNHLELLHIIETDDDDEDGGDKKNNSRPTYKWMKDLTEPIRIHVEIDKEIYRQYLGDENSSRLPDMVITRIFPVT